MNGLSKVPTSELKMLLGMLHRQELRCPLDAVELARTGMQERTEDMLDMLRGLPAEAVRAVIVAVLAERLHARF